MKKHTARAAKTARTPKHQIPIGLQLAAKALDQTDHDHAHLLSQLGEADAIARRLLEDPLIRLEDEGGIGAVEGMARANGAGDIEDRIAAMIPNTATHDPHAAITEACVAWGDAGLFLGLCLGWRLTAALRRTDEAR
jgi:hypothetical protein